MKLLAFNNSILYSKFKLAKTFKSTVRCPCSKKWFRLSRSSQRNFFELSFVEVVVLKRSSSCLDRSEPMVVVLPKFAQDVGEVGFQTPVALQCSFEHADLGPFESDMPSSNPAD